jgi:hypothetical protein
MLMGGPDMAPDTPQRSPRPGFPGAGLGRARGRSGLAAAEHLLEALAGQP